MPLSNPTQEINPVITTAQDVNETDEIKATEPDSEYDRLLASFKPQEPEDPEDDNAVGIFGRVRSFFGGAVESAKESVADLIPEGVKEFAGDIIESESQKIEELGVIGTLKDIGTQALGGVVDATREITETVDSVGEAIFGEQEKEFFFDEHGRRIEGKAPEGVEQQQTVDIKDTFPTIEKGQTGTGNVVRGVTQFAAPFAVGGAGLKAAGVAAKSVVGKVAQSTVLGAAVDATAFSPNDKRVADLIDESFPDYQGPVAPVIEFLKSDPADTEAQGRLKNALEGAVLGIGLDAVVEAATAIKPLLRKNKIHTGDKSVPFEAVDPEQQAAVDEALATGGGLELKIDYPDGSKTVPIDYGTKGPDIEAALGGRPEALTVETPAGDIEAGLIDRTPDIQAAAKDLPEGASHIKIVSGDQEIDLGPVGAPETSIPNVAKQIEDSPDVKLVAEGPEGPIEINTSAKNLAKDVQDLPEGAANARVVAQDISGPRVLPVSKVTDQAEAINLAAKKLPIDQSDIRIVATTPAGPLDLPIPLKAQPVGSLDEAATALPRDASDVRVTAQTPSGPIDLPVAPGVEPAQAIKDVEARLPVDASDVKVLAQSPKGPVELPVGGKVDSAPEIDDIAQKLPKEAENVRVVAQTIDGPVEIPVGKDVEPAAAIKQVTDQLPREASDIRLIAEVPEGSIELPVPAKSREAESIEQAAKVIPRDASDVKIVARTPEGPIDLPVDLGVEPAPAIKHVADQLPRDATDIQIVAQTIEGPVVSPISRDLPRDIGEITSQIPEGSSVRARVASEPPAPRAPEPQRPTQPEQTLEDLGGPDAQGFTVGKTQPDGSFQEIGKVKTPELLSTFNREAPSGRIKAEPKRAHNRNLKYINTTEDIKKLISDATTEAADLINSRRREVIPKDQTLQLAKTLGLTVDDLLSRRQGQAFNAEELVAAQQLVTDFAGEVDRLKRVAEKSRNPVDEVEFVKSLKVFNALQAQYRGGVAEAGRALNALRYATGTSAEQTARAKELIAERGGIDRIYKAYNEHIPGQKIQGDPDNGGARNLCARS